MVLSKECANALWNAIECKIRISLTVFALVLIALWLIIGLIYYCHTLKKDILTKSRGKLDYE